MHSASSPSKTAKALSLFRAWDRVILLLSTGCLSLIFRPEFEEWVNQTRALRLVVPAQYLPIKWALEIATIFAVFALINVIAVITQKPESALRINKIFTTV